MGVLWPLHKLGRTPARSTPTPPLARKSALRARHRPWRPWSARRRPAPTRRPWISDRLLSATLNAHTANTLLARCDRDRPICCYRSADTRRSASEANFTPRLFRAMTRANAPDLVYSGGPQARCPVVQRTPETSASASFQQPRGRHEPHPSGPFAGARSVAVLVFQRMHQRAGDVVTSGPRRGAR